MMDRIKYVCKKCGWTKYIRAEWADLKPKRCANKRCNMNFLAKSEMLEIVKPGVQKKVPVDKKASIKPPMEQPAIQEEAKPAKKAEDGKASSKKKRSGKVEQQQAQKGES